MTVTGFQSCGVLAGLSPRLPPTAADSPVTVTPASGHWHGGHAKPVADSPASGLTGWRSIVANKPPPPPRSRQLARHDDVGIFIVYGCAVLPCRRADCGRVPV